MKLCTRFLTKFWLKATAKAIDGSNYTPPLTHTKVSLIWENLFDSKHGMAAILFTMVGQILQLFQNTLVSGITTRK